MRTVWHPRCGYRCIVDGGIPKGRRASEYATMELLLFQVGEVAFVLVEPGFGRT
jgi:hypothetical protein